MKITELEKLAKAALNEPAMEKERFVNWVSAYVPAANPQTILAMIELLREMSNSLQILDDNYEEMEGEDGLVAVVPLSLANLCSEALANYKEMLK